LNKDLNTQYEKESSEMMGTIKGLKGEVLDKVNKIETLKDIVHSFQEEIKHFEAYQEAATRDIEKLKLKSEMYKKLYEQERAEKML
jgi:predicted RNase H-like nuclease (RuvC/YqgF family)